MHSEGAGDATQRSHPRVGGAGFDRLIGGAADAGSKEDALLCAVLLDAGDADAVTHGALRLAEPFVVVGQVWHSTNARPKMIISQPCKQGFL